MYIKVAKKKKEGKQYEQYQLKESFRTPAGPRNRIVLNLGVDLKISEEDRKLLADTIEMILHNQASLFPVCDEIYDLAEKYAREIQIKQLSDSESSSIECVDENGKDYEHVDLNSFKVFENRSIGLEHIVVSQLDDYKFDRILRNLEFTEKEIMLAKVLIAARICNPSSERETVRWAKHDSSISELLGNDDTIHDTGLHKVSVKLYENKGEIEKALSLAAKSTFDLSEDIILYDLTNTFFESSKKNSDIAKHGRSKEKRSDCPLITIALTVDADGFPKRSQMLKGNLSEPESLQSALEELGECDLPQLFFHKKTIVMDAGIASEKNIELIKSRGYSYVVVSRKSSFSADLWDNSEETNVEMSNGIDVLKLKALRVEDELFLLCHSDVKKQKEESILNQKMKRFEEDLQKMKDALHKKKSMKKYSKIIERIGRLKQKYGVGSLYDIEVKLSSSDENRDEKLVSDIVFNRNNKSSKTIANLGNYVLRTDRTDLCVESISKIHRSLTTIEDSFRSMKSDLGLRPNFHQTDKNSISHMFIVVLALHIIMAIMKKLQTNKIKHKISTIRNMLSTHRRVSAIFDTSDDQVVEIRTTGIPNAEQREIYRALNIKQKPLETVKKKMKSFVMQ